MKSLAQPGDKADIVRRLQALGPDSSRRWGRMTVQQMVCHLADNARVALLQRSVSVYTPWWARTVLKWGALWAPVQWPSGIPTRPELDQVRGGGTKPAELAKDITELRGLVERMVTDTELGGREHPFLGKLSRAEWLRWAYLHMDHHLRQFGV
jgi:hypothetical protein